MRGSRHFAGSATWVLAVAGFVMHVESVPTNVPGVEATPLFLGAFMLTSVGYFFNMLAHPAIYRPCFASSRLPHPVVGAVPAAIIVAGAGLLLGEGAMGTTGSIMILVGTAILTRWIWGPLWSLITSRREWHRD